MVPLYNEGGRAISVATHVLRLPNVAEAVLVDASDDPASRAIIARLRRRLRAHPRLRVLTSAAIGRGCQMNVGAAHCAGARLLFLHCDTRLPADAAARVAQALSAGADWGWFEVRLEARGAAYRIIERMVNLRTRASGIASGDQAMFMRRSVFAAHGGFADLALMEDLDLSRRLKRRSRPARITTPARTSARRWQQHGVLRTVLLMWNLRAQYYLGADPARLAARYRQTRRGDAG